MMGQWEYLSPSSTNIALTNFEILGSFNNSRIEEKLIENYVLSSDTPTIINGVEKVWNGPVIGKQPLYKRIVIKRLTNV